MSVSVTRGTFPKGFKVAGKTLGQAIAAGSVAYNASGKKHTYADSDTEISAATVIATEGETFGQELVYYVSEQGNDSYSGTQPGSAKKTLVAAFDQARADNNGSYNFPAGTKLTIYVEGTVYNKSGSNILGGGQVFLTGSYLDHVPITIETYNYKGNNPATIITDHMCVNDGNASMYIVNDLYFKDIKINAKTNASTGFVSNKLYAAGCSLTFDNTLLTNDGKATAGGRKWSVYADNYGTGGFNPLSPSYPLLYGCVTFKNGDYTNLERVAAVGAPSIWRDEKDGGSVYEVPGMHCKVVIDEGAEMGGVYGTYGTLKVGSATVEIKGGALLALYGTNSGTAEKPLTYGTPLNMTVCGGGVNKWIGTGRYITINADVTNTLSAGGVAGTQFCGLGSHVTLNGNLTNNISGGKMVISAVDSENNGGHGIWLAGRDYVTINGNVVNNISGGELGVKLLVDSVQTGIWMGMRENGKITGNLTNNISGGTIYTRTDEYVTAEYADFHAGIFSGCVIQGTLTNNFTGGTFEIARGSFYLGQQGVSGSTGKIVNILGDKDTGEGPTFKGTNHIYLGGNFGRVGVTSNIGTLPAEADCTDTVVIRSTIYGGTYGGSVYGSNASTAGTHVTYVKGSVQTDVYGGTFGTFCGTGGGPIYGRSVTNIHGGTFGDIWASGGAIVYDGMQLNIYGLDKDCDPTTISAGAGNGNISARTSGREAMKFTIAPTGQLKLSSELTVLPWGSGSISGTTKVQVSGGTYTKGFAVNGVTVKAALAPGMGIVKDSDSSVVTVTDEMTTTGTESVTITRNPAIAKGIADATEALEKLSESTVKSSDSQTLAQVKTSITNLQTTYATELTDEEAATLNTLLAKVNTLQAKVESVSAAISNVQADLKNHSADTVTEADRAPLQELAAALNAIADSNLTESEQQQKKADLEKINGLLALLESSSAIIGDFTGDNAVTDADVIYLLWHTVFSEDYPLNGKFADFTGDNAITDADVIYLLWHTVFPEDYPLNK